MVQVAVDAGRMEELVLCGWTGQCRETESGLPGREEWDCVRRSNACRQEEDGVGTSFGIHQLEYLVCLVEVVCIVHVICMIEAERTPRKLSSAWVLVRLRLQWNCPMTEKQVEARRRRDICTHSGEHHISRWMARMAASRRASVVIPE